MFDSALVEALQLITILFVIIGPVGLWFGLGSRIGKVEQRLSDHIDSNGKVKDAIEKQVSLSKETFEKRLARLENTGRES